MSSSPPQVEFQFPWTYTPHTPIGRESKTCPANSTSGLRSPIGPSPGGATTTGPDATPPPSYLSKLGGGGPAGGRGGVKPGVGGGGEPGVRGGGSNRGSGGGLAGGQGGVQPGVRGGAGSGLWFRLGLGLALGLGSPSWWNQSWFYNPF